ncbi:MAG TPA: hypothetical protein VGJ60_07500 [Chloroflexota bacterium]|jgi:hypothetical protein
MSMQAVHVAKRFHGLESPYFQEALKLVPMDDQQLLACELCGHQVFVQHSARAITAPQGAPVWCIQCVSVDHPVPGLELEACPSPCVFALGALRVWEIEARTRYRVAAHSAHAALQVLHELDECTPLDEHISQEVDVQFIASCSVDESTIEDVSDEHDHDHPLWVSHRDACSICRGETSGK